MTWYPDFSRRGERAETGVFLVNGDWPGIFIRGDKALGTADLLRGFVAGKMSIDAMKILAAEIADILEECRVDASGVAQGFRR